MYFYALLLLDIFDQYRKVSRSNEGIGTVKSGKKYMRLYRTVPSRREANEYGKGRRRREILPLSRVSCFFVGGGGCCKGEFFLLLPLSYKISSRLTIW